MAYVEVHRLLSDRYPSQLMVIKSEVTSLPLQESPEIGRVSRETLFGPGFEDCSKSACRLGKSEHVTVRVPAIESCDLERERQ